MKMQMHWQCIQQKLASLMEELNSEYHHFRYSIFNVYNAYEELDKNPTSYGKN